jgi:hypothetical protein
MQEPPPFQIYLKKVKVNPPNSDKIVEPIIPLARYFGISCSNIVAVKATEAAFDSMAKINSQLTELVEALE